MTPPPWSRFRYRVEANDNALLQINELELFGVPVQRAAPVDDLGRQLVRLVEQGGGVEGRRRSGSRHGHGSVTGERGRVSSDVTARRFFA